MKSRFSSTITFLKAYARLFAYANSYVWGMERMLRATLLDKIIHKFSGNVSFNYETEVHAESWYKGIHENFYEMENLFFQLFAEDVLIKDGEMVRLTNKGLSILTDIDNYGYVFKERERIKQQKINCILIWSTVIGAIVGIITLICQIKQGKG